MPSYQYLNVKIAKQIAYVTLSRPEKHNAINMTLFKELDRVIKEIKANKSIRVVIVDGQGDDFCSGIDIKSVFNKPRNAFKLLIKFLPWRANLAQKVSTGWRNMPIPVIFALHGRCWGAGLQIALGGDFRIATPEASIAIMEARWGLIPDMGGTLTLRETLDIDQAKILAMTGKEIDGNKALSLGLISNVSETPLETAITLANQLKEQSPDAIAACKKLYNKSWRSKSAWVLMRESYYQIKILLGKNYQIKTYNQKHSDQPQKEFYHRKNW